MIYLKNIDGVPTTAPQTFIDKNGIFHPAFNQNIDLMLSNDYIAYDENDYAQYLAGAKTFTDTKFINIPTTEYTNDQIAMKKTNIQTQIDALDLKCIRALREGGIKDESTGQSWVDYYTEQIAALRTTLNSL